MERSAPVLFLVLVAVATTSASIDYCKAFYPPDSQCVPNCDVHAGYIKHTDSLVLCKGENTCCEPPPEQSDDVTSFPPNPSTDPNPLGMNCGAKGGARKKRAIGGVVNPACSWPWLVSITIENSEKYIAKSHIMTGVLISSKAILVLNQTFIDITGPFIAMSSNTIVTAVMGEYYLNMVGDEKVKQKIDVKNAAPAGDFLILNLSDAVEVSECVRPICLDNVTLELDKCMLAGWGDIEKRTGGLAFAHIPLSVSAKVDTPSFCKRLVGFAPDVKYTSSTLCLELPEAKMATENDIGSPIMCPDTRGLWHLKGLLTKGNYNREDSKTLLAGPFGVDIMGSLSDIMRAIPSE